MPKYYINPFAISGDKASIPDATQPSGVVSYEEGFGEDYQKVLGTDPDALPIPRDQTNQLYYDLTLNVQQYQQHGFPEFITTDDNGGVPFPYDIYAIVRYQPSDISPFFLYQSLETGNDTLPTDTTKWQLLDLVTPGVPTGAMFDFGGDTAPDGFLLCDGTAVLRTGDTAALFGVIGVIWGPGDGSTTFNLPDFRRRVAMGSGGTAVVSPANTVGSVGGAETHSLSGAENGTHNHNGAGTISGNVAGGSPTGITMGANSTSGVTRASDITMPDSGSGTAHNNVQPSAVVLKIIKT